MRNLLTLIASLGLVACVGGIDQAPGDDDVIDPDPSGTGGGTTNATAAAEAKKLFTDNVQPIIAATGKCITCHNKTGPVGNITGFVDADLTTAYATATGYQAVVGNWTAAGAPILTIVTVSAHKGMTYSADESLKITNWLNKEVEARSTGGNTTPSPTGETPQAASQRLLAEWSGCMSLTNFEAADMRAWGNVNAGGGGNCKTCHSLAEFGFIASNVSTPFFDTIATNKYYMLQYFSVDLTAGVAAAKVIVNDRSFKGVGQRLTPHEAHPGFNPTQNAGFAALQKFYTATMTRKTAGTPTACDASRLTN